MGVPPPGFPSANWGGVKSSLVIVISVVIDGHVQLTGPSRTLTFIQFCVAIAIKII